MGSLSSMQKELIFDYAVGIASDIESSQAKSLISTNIEASEIYSKIKSSLSVLDLEAQTCPDELFERTVMRLNNLAVSSQDKLRQLLATEQAKGMETAAPGRLWSYFGKKLATAAVFMIAGTILITSLNIITTYARQNYQKQQCQMQLAKIWRGMNHYVADNDGRLPATATAAGTPWWKVGYQGSENHSNTRRMWLLVKGDYVDPADFCCPATSNGKAILLEAAEIKKLNDFPSRKAVSYSFRIMCSAPSAKSPKGQRVLIADLNPLFENLPSDFSNSFKLRLNRDLLSRNSINHNRRGQNVMFCDGSIRFVRTRRLGISEDDIFTLQDVELYKGFEVPSCETDNFLAP